MGHLAQHLHRLTLAFNDSARLIEQALTQLDVNSRTARASLTGTATIHPQAFDASLVHVVSLLQRHGALAQTFLDAYRAWRADHAIDRDATLRYLLVHPGDTTFGVFALHRLGSEPDTWFVAPDRVAATRFGIPYAERIIGEVVLAEQGWQPTAHTNPDHVTTNRALIYTLPGQYDLTTACRSLMRWWQLRHSPAWRNRTPDQLTGDEIAALTR